MTQTRFPQPYIKIRQDDDTSTVTAYISLADRETGLPMDYFLSSLNLIYARDARVLEAWKAAVKQILEVVLADCGITVKGFNEGPPKPN